MKKIPRPTNPRVKVVSVPPAAGAVTKFSGWVSSKKADAKRKQLLDQLCVLGVDAKSQPHELWQFHPPFTIPFLRRNEIWVELTPKQVTRLKQAGDRGRSQLSISLLGDDHVACGGVFTLVFLVLVT